MPQFSDKKIGVYALFIFVHPVHNRSIFYCVSGHPL